MALRVPERFVTRVRSTLHPEGFHGQRETRGFFEGWYVKLVSADRGHRWAVIPGVFLGLDGDDEAFVQVLDGTTGRSWYQRYDRSQFAARPDAFDVTVGPNRFTAEGMTLDVEEAGLRGEVRFTDPLDPWPVRAWSPGSMGWYAWVPRMECYHGILSFGHGLDGTLDTDGGPVRFDGGRGYLEKDWGRAFPSAYVWMQTNHFTEPGTCLTASIALVPWLRGEFRGMVVGLRHDGRLHRFTTYTGARTTALEVDDDHVRWRLRSRPGATLDLVADRTRGGLLHAPIRTQMHRRVEETLDARVRVRFADPDGRVVLEDEGHGAGLEVHGDLRRLLAAR
ncbi:tocopherol cyclase family protein [Actinoplanes subglobosus]|uniref:Tocopherol cyclase family protein n=1 Tax=Actinoplanes subglobosus TaxID=1547892 RepID=A0ABV8IWM9_9ACTN